MLVVSPLRTNNDGTNNNGRDTTMETSFSIGGSDDFVDFPGGNLLESIDFDDLFMGMHDDGDVLPDLEMDPELLAEFSLSGGEDSNNSTVENINPNEDHKCKLFENEAVSEGTKQVDNSDTKVELLKKSSSEEEIQSKKAPDPESDSTTTTLNSSFKEGEKVKKSSLNSKNGSNNNQGKRKAKVDWTPELHRRFVQAVEQLGVDKAVPSRILELMGIDCLTRHNIASHLQKYRSHRKHLLAREAEAANWTQKRQLYGVAMGGGKNNTNISPSPWHAPTLGFPPVSTMHHHPFRPLHVWGHPTMDLQSRMPIWPKQVVPSPTPPPLPPAWTPPPPADPSFWHPPHHRVLNAMTAATQCFPQPLPATRFTASAMAVPGIPSHTMLRPDHGATAPPPGYDTHPSTENIDAAIGDILSKPWQPLPIGLKPPSVDSVLVELQRQGVPKIPPSSA